MPKLKALSRCIIQSMSGYSNMHDHIFPLNLNGGPQSALNDSFHMGDAIMNYSDYLQLVKTERGKK